MIDDDDDDEDDDDNGQNSQLSDKNVVGFKISVNNLTLMHLVHDVQQMNRQNGNKPFLELCSPLLD